MSRIGPPTSALLAALLLSACGAASSPPQGQAADPRADPQTSARAEASSPDAAAPPPAAAPMVSARPLREAATSLPDGVTPLTPEEAKSLATDCKPFSDVVARAVAKTKVDPSFSRAEQILAALASPPTVQGVDVPRCVELTRRDLTAFAARQAESEVNNQLKLIAVNLAVAYQDGKKVCPSSGPTPATLDGLAKGRVVTTSADWSGPGWACVRFDPSSTPVRWQYEFSTDVTRGTWRVEARGYPTQGAPLSEVLLEGTIGADGPTSPGSLMRR